MAVRDNKTEWIRVAGYRRMTPQQRVQIAQGLIRTGRKTVEGAIRQQRPDLTPYEFEIELWNRIYSREWARRVRALPRRGRQNVEDWQIVARITRTLEENDVPYAIVGGYSAIYWGRPRFTQDADLLVDLPPQKVSPLAQVWAAEFVVDRERVEEAVRTHSEFNLIHQAKVYKMDLWVPARTPYEHEVLRRRKRGALGNGEAYYQSAEDTILSKLRGCKLANFSERQYGDALGVYEIQEPTLDQGYLDRWAVTLDVTDLLARVRAEAARPPEEG